MIAAIKLAVRTLEIPYLAYQLSDYYFSKSIWGVLR
jgi:hypothetical protein